MREGVAYKSLMLIFSSHVSVFRIGDAAGDAADFPGLARWMLDLVSGLVSSGSKSSSRSARGSSGSALDMRLFLDSFWTLDSPKRGVVYGYMLPL